VTRQRRHSLSARDVAWRSMTRRGWPGQAGLVLLRRGEAERSKAGVAPRGGACRSESLSSDAGQGWRGRSAPRPVGLGVVGGAAPARQAWQWRGYAERSGVSPGAATACVGIGDERRALALALGVNAVEQGVDLPGVAARIERVAQVR
jgi:hypothetical protein